MSLFESLDRRYENVVNATQPQQSSVDKKFGLPPTRDVGFMATTLLGESAGAVGDVVGEVVGQLGFLVPDFIKDWTNQTVQGAVDSKLGKQVDLWSKENPKEWQEIKNVVNIFTVGKGTSLIKEGMADQKGALFSGQPNYIKNFYGNDKKDIPPSMVEKTMGEQYLKLKKESITPPKVAMAGKRATGLVEWIMSAPMNVADAMLNPYSRALYAETGISRMSQKRVDSLINNPNATKRDVDQAMGQAIYNRNLNIQSGRKGPTSQSLIDIEDFATVQGYRPFNIDNFLSGVLKTKSKLKGKDQYVSPKDATKAYGYIKDAWNIGDRPTQVIFKQPLGGSAGNHLNDLAQKNPANTAIRKAISSFPKRPTTINLYKKLLDESQKEGSKFKVLNPSVDDVTKNGLWIQSSFVGKSIVEGGVNGIYKVLPNGRVQGYVSDVHNFLEKIPVVGSAVERALPTDVLAVSGPIHLDIMGTKWAAKEAKRQNKEFVSRPKPQTTTRVTDINDQDLLLRFAKVKPDNLMEGVKTPAGVALVAGGKGLEEEEEQR